MFLKSYTQPPEPKIFFEYLSKNYPSGEYNCAYEAGFSGFWAQRQLNELGINCILIHAMDLPKSHKSIHSKTDQVDSKSIGATLQAGLLSAIYIPSVEIEANRQLGKVLAHIAAKSSKSSVFSRNHFF